MAGMHIGNRNRADRFIFERGMQVSRDLNVRLKTSPYQNNEELLGAHHFAPN